VIENESYFPHSRINLAELLILNNNFDKAFEVLEEARNMLENDKSHRFNNLLICIYTFEAFAYIKMQDIEKAEWYEKRLKEHEELHKSELHT
jgi:hypothetical protein